MGWKDFHICVLLLLVIGDDCVNSRIGDIKCSKWYPSLPTASERVKPSSSRVGFAEPGQFPHAATLGYGEKNTKWRCAGTLISEKYVLTVAYCLTLRNSQNVSKSSLMYVRLGVVDLDTTITEKTINMQTIKIARTIFHPNFNNASMHYYNIGLIELATNVKIDDYVRPACLYTDANLPKEEWGGVTWGYYLKSKQCSFDNQRNRLKEIKWSPVTHYDCNATYTDIAQAQKKLNHGIENASQICARRDGHQDDCLVESGSPLQTKNSNPLRGYKVFGLTSFGLRNSQIDNEPVVFERISHYIQWIESMVWPNTKG